MMALPCILNDEKGMFCDLPPLISEEEIVESLSHIGKGFFNMYIQQGFYGADKHM